MNCLLKIILFMVLFFLTASAELYAEKLILRYPRPESLKDVRHIYRFELLKLAMDRTKAVYGDFEIVYTAAEMTQSRALTELENNGVVDVIALPSNVEREKKFLPVRIPVMKGILGYRIFIINKDQKDRFRKIKKLSDLKKLKAGAGHDWADVQILEKNGIDVERGGKYEGLFFMLAAGRFDYFPRGVNEAKKEIEDRQGTLPDLMIEETLALYYPFPVYFFVNKNNPELARRIEAGLNYAINDGSFELLFSRYFKAYLADADLKNRKIFRLKNPFLPAETPYKNRSLWYNIDR